MPKKKQRKRYTEQFKAEAVRAVENRGSRTVADVAEALGVPEHMLYAWRKTAKPALEARDRGESKDEELERLRRELAEVKRERDVLVKSVAVFVRERK